MDRLAAMRVRFSFFHTKGVVVDVFCTTGSATGRVSLLVIQIHTGSLTLWGHSNSGYQRQNPYARQDDHAYEMADVRDSSANLTSGGDSMSDFYAEVGASCHGHGRPANVLQLDFIHSRHY